MEEARQPTAVTQWELAEPWAPIFRNAIRLLEDARLLRKARRYPSTAALAILSLEELGKFLLCHEGFLDWIGRPAPSKGSYTHKQKQKAAAEMLAGVLTIDQVVKLVEARGYRIEVVLKSTQQLKAITFADIMMSIDHDTYSRKIAGRVRQDRHVKFLLDLIQGRFDKTKQQCLYVDVDKNGRLQDEPGKVGRVIADKMIRLASGGIHETEAMLRRFSRAKAARRPGSLDVAKP